ncbi:hypothetical protein [Mycobacterium sp. 3519A]|uniref:ATP-binding protein n=1 Tax=Mycobacterium sp. 3519A TaxID=2057184 RepID=UPI00115719FE|nr:hypothetical protein [Mycobacterium sp. 3519A]
MAGGERRREDICVSEQPAADCVRAAARRGIGSKSALIEHAAAERGIAASRLSNSEVLIDVPGWGSSVYFHHMNGPRSIGGRFYCDEKAVARDILRSAGLNVATSRAFAPHELEEGLQYAESIGYPVVVKPTNCARGTGVTANVQSPDALMSAWRRASAANFGWFDKAATIARSLCESPVPSGGSGWKAQAAAYRDAIRRAASRAWESRFRPVLVEKHFDGNDFRAFVVGDKVVSVTQRKRANVIGDGVATIRELIERKNAIRAGNAYLRDCPIPTRPDVLDLMSGAGLTTAHIPARDETVVLRSASNLSAGGDSIDVTDEAHPEFIDIAVKAVRAIPAVEYAGVDLITPDITAPPTAANHIVSEVEHSPAMLAHFPLVGAPRDMAGAVLQHYLEQGVGLTG